MGLLQMVPCSDCTTVTSLALLPLEMVVLLIRFCTELAWPLHAVKRKPTTQQRHLNDVQLQQVHQVS